MLPLLRIFRGIALGEVQERLNWPPWKGGILVRVSWVRIPPSPQCFISTLITIASYGSPTIPPLFAIAVDSEPILKNPAGKRPNFHPGGWIH
jgi:hypothetical protein